MKKIALAVLMLFALAAPAGAQSLFSSRGLGVPSDPVDPRARGMGSNGVGLFGLNTSMVNPAELSGVRRRGVVAMLQPFYGSDELAGLDDNISGTRFPLIQLLYPFRERWVFGFGYGGVLEQSWGVFSDGEEVIGGQPVATRELITSRGAVAQARVTASYTVSATLSAGLAVGLYTGDLQRAITRSFPDTTLEFLPFTVESKWGYRGGLASFGVRYDPVSNIRLAATATVSTDLDADADTANALDHSYNMPVRVAAGASVLLAPRLMATASVQYAGWSESANYAAPGTVDGSLITAQPTLEFGAGLEWEQLQLLGRVVPVRLGYRMGDLPFFLQGDEPAKEWAASLGAGLRLAADDAGPLAVGDLSIERGKRTGWDLTAGGGLTESFWRFSASIALFGR